MTDAAAAEYVMTKQSSWNLFPDKTKYMHVDDDVIADGIAAPLTKFVSKLDRHI